MSLLVAVQHANGMADHYRSQARSLAWYDAEGEAPSHNPFGRTRSRPERTLSSSLEAGGSNNYTMTDMERVKEPETMHGAVPSTAGTDGVQGGTESVTSTAPLTRAAGDIKADEQDVHRKSGGSESVDKQQETTPREDAPAAGHAKQFTVAGQLRATLFSSWINILLVAAPAGSTFAQFFDQGCQKVIDMY